MNTVVSHTIGVKTPQSLVLKYKSELTRAGSQEEEQHIINKLLPSFDGTDYCAKPSQATHTSYSDGVWLVKNERKQDDKDSMYQYVSTVGHGFEDKPRQHFRETVSASFWQRAFMNAPASQVL